MEIILDHPIISCIIAIIVFCVVFSLRDTKRNYDDAQDSHKYTGSDYSMRYNKREKQRQNDNVFGILLGYGLPILLVFLVLNHFLHII